MATYAAYRHIELDKVGHSKKSYQLDLDRRLSSTQNTEQLSLDDLVQHMTSQIMNSTRRTITKLKTTRNPKISPKTQQLMTERRKLERSTPQYREINKTVNKAIRKDTSRIHSTNMMKECIAQNSNMKVLRKNRAKNRTKIYQLMDSEDVTHRNPVTGNGVASWDSKPAKPKTKVHKERNPVTGETYLIASTETPTKLDNNSTIHIKSEAKN
ncbi:unnamed protein product [Ceutorhynchus assimilis]|uniref:Uncharacterized protein n=1 Tax=Ceutorhynchus assimilis TaxID=467358 RepID=A0A9N9QMF5_9CUCU|nr:unnamed protein product [Ceutorhynchus assimilis]